MEFFGCSLCGGCTPATESSDKPEDVTFTEITPAKPAGPAKVVGNFGTAMRRNSSAERLSMKESREAAPGARMAIAKHFRGAITQLSMVKGLGAVLRKHGYAQERTLAACCVCSDEINRYLDGSLQEHVACLPPFNLGGLAGLPFTGATGFGAYSHHVPAGGALVVVFGPHVGVAATGEVGSVEREGVEGLGGACGAAKAAYAAVCQMPAAQRKKGVPIVPSKKDAERILTSDFQQHIVTHHVCACHAAASAAAEPQAELVKQLHGRIRDSLMLIVPSLDCDLALLGGVQINTGPDSSDFFLPLSFELKKANSMTFDDLLPELTSRFSSMVNTSSMENIAEAAETDGPVLVQG